MLEIQTLRSKNFGLEIGKHRGTLLRADYAERIGRQWSAIGIQHKRPIRAGQRLSSGLARPKSDGLHDRPQSGWCRRQ